LTTAVQTFGSVLTVTLAGQVIVGGSLSVTVTVNVQLAEPSLLVAVQETVVTPFGKANPEAGVQTTVGTGHPVVIVEKVSVAVHTPGSVLVAIFAGQVIVGGMNMSVTVGLAAPTTLGSSVSTLEKFVPETVP
jgi:hypothetical protein